MDTAKKTTGEPEDRQAVEEIIDRLRAIDNDLLLWIFSGKRPEKTQ